MFEKIDFKSEFFNLYKLSEGIYGAISKPDSGMGSNAGFIDLGDFSVIIDTTLSNNAIKDLNKAVIQYTGKEPKVVVITHYHLDHVIGNSLFDTSTLIITSDRTLNNIQTENSVRIEQLKAMEQKELDKMKEALKTEKDEEKRKDIENDLRFINNIQKGEVILRDPNATFKEEFTLHGNERTLYLRTFKKAHTDGDVIAYIPEEKILFAGDLLFAQVDPWLGSGNPNGWISVIDEIIKMDFKVVVPGHGEIASKEEFYLEKKYINEIIELVKKHIISGDKIKREDFSSEFQTWTSLILEWNIEFLTKYLKN
ncbi:MAG: MBL fold metallo-hydrolase [Candidatus Heimdallarchaeota archaeon]